MEIGNIALIVIMCLFGAGIVCGVSVMVLRAIGEAINRLIAFFVAVMTAIFGVLLSLGILYTLIKVI